MSTKKNICCILICFLIITSALSGCSGYSDVSKATAAAVNADVELIDEEKLIETVRELTSEKYAGRMTGTEGNEAAASYIAERFREIGLVNPQGLKNYMQRYPQTVLTLKDIPQLSIEGSGDTAPKKFKYVENFVVRALSSKTEDISINAPLHLIKDLNEVTPENKDIKGKLLLIPWAQRQAMTFSELVSLVSKSGAEGAIGEYDIKTPSRGYAALTITPMLGPWLEEEHCPFVNVDNDSFADFVSASEKGGKVSFSCSFTRENNKKVPNVVGLLPGTDEKLKDQYIIIGAHFDHVGQNLDGSFNPGGLDNSSGIAAMLEIARVLKTNNSAVDKPVLFIAFNGEEGGLQGSEYYAGHPVYPIDNSVMINLDMVGSSEKLPLVISGVRDSKLELHGLMYDYCKELGIIARKELGGGSDHESFASRGVNSVLLINDDFMNGYHSPGDTLEDVDKERLEQVVKLVLFYLDKNAYN